MAIPALTAPRTVAPGDVSDVVVIGGAHVADGDRTLASGICRTEPVFHGLAAA